MINEDHAVAVLFKILYDSPEAVNVFWMKSD